MAEAEPGQEKRRDSRRAMGKAVAKAGGFTALSAGTLTIAKDAHVLDHGTVSFDSILHMQTPGGGGGQTVSISDGGIALICDKGWTIDGFALGWSKGLGERPAGTNATDDPKLSDVTLRKRVDEVAASIILTAPHGDVLVVGSTDPKEFITARMTNADLAQARADSVAKLLRTEFGDARSVISVNQLLKYSPRGDNSDNALARMLFGRQEISGRTAQVCVGEPRPHRVDIGGAAGGKPGLLDGLMFGAGVLLIVALAVGLLTFFWKRAQRAGDEPTSELGPAAGGGPVPPKRPPRASARPGSGYRNRPTR